MGRCARLPQGFFTRTAPTPVSAPELIALNRPLAQRLGLDPDCRVAIASYSGTLASKFNRRVQRILESQEYAAFFPDTSIKRGAKPPGYIRTADEVEIIGRRGGLLSVGREGSLTGNRVDCFVLDDLYI